MQMRTLPANNQLELERGREDREMEKIMSQDTPQLDTAVSGEDWSAPDIRNKETRCSTNKLFKKQVPLGGSYCKLFSSMRMGSMVGY